MICAGPFCILGYEDGLITVWDIESGNFVFPMIGHTNRVNHLITTEE
jgi:WD40 repeat protein